MMLRDCRHAAGALCLSLALAGSAAAADLVPYRAVYSLALGTAKPGRGVVGATGKMTIDTGQTCDGWTTEQHYTLAVQNSDADGLDMASNFVSWEAKDGLRFHFFERDLRNGAQTEEDSGEAALDGPGKGGTVRFTRPEGKHLTLPPGVVFPMAQTALIIDRAKANDSFFAVKVFDGTSDDDAATVTAVIGAALPAGRGTAAARLKSPLLARPSWPVHLAFFSSEASADVPDFELDMRLRDNGVAGDMVLDYGDYSVHAVLQQIQALPAPNC